MAEVSASGVPSAPRFGTGDAQRDPIGKTRIRAERFVQAAAFSGSPDLRARRSPRKINVGKAAREHDAEVALKLVFTIRVGKE